MVEAHGADENTSSSVDGPYLDLFSTTQLSSQERPRRTLPCGGILRFGLRWRPCPARETLCMRKKGAAGRAADANGCALRPTSLPPVRAQLGAPLSKLHELEDQLDLMLRDKLPSPGGAGSQSWQPARDDDRDVHDHQGMSLVDRLYCRWVGVPSSSRSAGSGERQHVAERAHELGEVGGPSPYGASLAQVAHGDL